MSEYVYLYSNIGEYNEDNNILNFDNTFNTPLSLKGDWEVSLVELFYPKFYKPVDLIFLVYLDCIEYSYVGSSTYPVIRSILLDEPNPGFACNIFTPSSNYYIPTNKKKIDAVRIRIESTINQEYQGLPLITGDILAVLHFKKI